MRIGRFSVAFLVLSTLLALTGPAGRAVAQLALEIDPLGQAFLANDGSKELAFDGYLIISNKGLLSPKGWSSIADQVQSNPGQVIASLGSGGLTFGEANPEAKALAELNIGGAGVLQPGAEFSIGYPFAKAVGPASGLKLSYKPVTEPNGIDGVIRFLEPPLGADLRILAGADGSAWLENLGSSPVSFDGYQLSDENGKLNPAGWMSIADYVGAGRGGEITALLGDGGLGFKQTNPGAGNLAELNLTAPGVLQPGGKLDLGKPFQPGEDLSSIAFNYRLLGNSLSQRGEIVSVPEPAAWLLAGLGGLALLARRGRRR